MDNHYLRAIILKLQDRLSDNDRIRLHFFLGDDVPRRIRDDPSLAGTFRLMESLFEQDKINDNDFSFLIHAFEQIQCTDAVKLLKEHRKYILTNPLNQSANNLTTIMPSIIDQITDDQEEDRGSVENFMLKQRNDTGQNNNNTTLNPVTVTVDTSRNSSWQSRQNHLILFFTKIKKYILLIALLILFTSSLLFVFLMMKNRQQNLIIRLNNLLFEQNKTINQLQKQLIDLENEKSTLLIKAGRKFGGIGGNHFDDSTLPKFTFSHYLSGLIVSTDPNDFGSCQFLYSSSISNQSRIESNVHGKHGEKMQSVQLFQLDQDERISKLQIYIFDLEFILSDGKRYTTKIVKSLNFFTTKGRKIPSYSSPTDQIFIEQFDGYTLGYATGNAGQCIDQLQFFWYRTT